MPGFDYSKFDRLVAEDEEEEHKLEAQRKQAEEQQAKQHAEVRRKKEHEALRQAEEEYYRRKSGSVGAGGCAKLGAQVSEADAGVTALSASSTCEAPTSLASSRMVKSEAVGREFDTPMREDEENVAVDGFFRPIADDEKGKRERLSANKEDRCVRGDQASGHQSLSEEGMMPQQVSARIEHLVADRSEMALLMQCCNRYTVKARLSEFLCEMDNELARLQEDPVELDDEDRRELRLFHLRKMQLPGVARAQREFAKPGQGLVLSR